MYNTQANEYRASALGGNIVKRMNVLADYQRITVDTKTTGRP